MEAAEFLLSSDFAGGSTGAGSLFSANKGAAGRMAKPRSKTVLRTEEST
jgi:hypothetical protein